MKPTKIQLAIMQEVVDMGPRVAPIILGMGSAGPRYRAGQGLIAKGFGRPYDKKSIYFTPENVRGFKRILNKRKQAT